MAKASKTSQPATDAPLTPSPQALKKALRDGAYNAQRVAQAFGVKFPVAAPSRTPTR